MGTETVKITDANTCINSLGPDGEGSDPLTNHRIEIIDLRGEQKEGTYEVINTKKSFYNEFELIEKIKQLAKEGNDMTFGASVRKLLNGEN